VPAGDGGSRKARRRRERPGGSPGAAAAEKRVDERRRLLDAARETLPLAGHESLKVRTVLARAGLSTRAFYRHFAGKEELLVALAEEEVDRATAALAALTASGSPTARVTRWIEEVVGSAFGARSSNRAKVTSLVSRAPATVLHGRPPAGVSFSGPLADAIAAGVATGEFSSPDPEQDARLVAALCTRLSTHAERSLPGDRDAAVAVVVAFVLRALTGRTGD
jgi:AcrR family transcriptional regulator